MLPVFLKWREKAHGKTGEDADRWGLGITSEWIYKSTFPSRYLSCVSTAHLERLWVLILWAAVYRIKSVSSARSMGCEKYDISLYF